MEDYHPELANYEPHERPVRSNRRMFVLRALVFVAIAGLVLPGVVTTVTFANSSAQAACDLWVNSQVPQQHRDYAKFEVFGEGIVGWECYAVTADGTVHSTSLGLLPGLNDEQLAIVRGGIPT